VLEHAKHDRADESKRDIRGNNAQLTDERHGKPPWFTSLPANAESSKPFPAKKVSLADPRHICPPANVVKES
jgi:hypothetical protein